MKQGDVCLAHFPFTDASASKLRPILIVSIAAHNQGADIVAVPISSRPDRADKFSVFVDQPEHQQAGLRVPSSIKWNKPATLSRTVIRRKLGELPEDILTNVIENLLSVFQVKNRA